MSASASAPAPIVVTPAGVPLEDVASVAIGGAPVLLAPEVLDRVAAGRAVVDRALSGETLYYGINTGLGHMRDQRVSFDELLAYQTRIVTASAGGVGPPLPDQDVRAIMFTRVAGLARGGSGAHPDALHMLVAMLNAAVHPIVPEVGSVGASDLMHMAAIAMTMIGRGEARYHHEIVPSAEALARAGITPYVMQPKDGLALISANGASVGCGALAVLEAERIAGLADLACALSLEAVAGNLSPFDAEAAAAKPVDGQIAAAAHVRALLHGSYLVDPATVVSVQDPLSFRVAPQVHGAMREQIVFARRSVEAELHAIDDNPLVSIESGRIISNGNFHPMVLALAFDALRIGLAHVGMIAERRASKVGFQRLAAFGAIHSEAGLTRRHDIAGLLTYSASALLAELKHLAAPATLSCPPLDFDVEDHATLAPLTVTLTRRALHLLESVLAAEICLAFAAIQEQAEQPALGRGTGAAIAAIASAFDAVDAAAGDISAATSLEIVRDTLHGLAV